MLTIFVKLSASNPSEATRKEPFSAGGKGTGVLSARPLRSGTVALIVSDERT